MNSTISATSKTILEAEFFSVLINHAMDTNSSIALWQLPNENVKHVILSQRYQYLKKSESLLEELAPGFIVAPFNKERDSLFLPADYSFSFKEGKLIDPVTPSGVNSHRWFNENLANSSRPATPKINYEVSKTISTGKENFIHLVEKSIAEIEKGTFEKVVASRCKEIILPATFDGVTAFRKVCQAYPNAFVSFVIIPGVGSWLGASPELLVSVDDKTTFKTVALAGTKPYTENTNLKTVAWTQKEIEEQALVERYIISCFKKIRLREYDEYGPKTVIAGNLMHLKSDFTVNIKEANFPQLGSTMLQLLHPTSAVCGMPLDAAINFLTKNEGYDREFYAGFLGPVNFNNNIKIFVNIRCLQVKGGTAICYAGAGITNDSIAEEEWNETEMKLNTLLKVIV